MNGSSPKCHIPSFMKIRPPVPETNMAAMLSMCPGFCENLYLLNMLIDQVDTLHVSRYWSQVLCCTIMIHLDDLEVKVRDLEFLC